jgi:UDP-N-acetylglucosamine 1-carboxyvinyltransferase
MQSLEIRGEVPLQGEVQISGAKNAALPIMAATLLTPEKCVIRHVPNLSDVKFMAKILTSLGAKVTLEGGEVTVQAARIKPVGNYNLIRKMRGSICILGPTLARQHHARGRLICI